MIEIIALGVAFYLLGVLGTIYDGYSTYLGLKNIKLAVERNSITASLHQRFGLKRGQAIKTSLNIALLTLFFIMTISVNMIIASVAQAGISCFLLGFGFRQLVYARSSLTLRVRCPKCGQLGVPQLENDLSQMVCYNCNTLYQIITKRKDAFNQCPVCGEIDIEGEKQEDYVCDADDLPHIIFTSNAEKADRYLRRLWKIVRISLIALISATAILLIPVFIYPNLYILPVIPSLVYFFFCLGFAVTYVQYKAELQKIITEGKNKQSNALLGSNGGMLGSNTYR